MTMAMSEKIACVQGQNWGEFIEYRLPVISINRKNIRVMLAGEELNVLSGSAEAEKSDSSAMDTTLEKFPSVLNMKRKTDALCAVAVS